MSENKKYSTIDLFAGAGGLSLGFIQTKRFDIKVAFENNPNMKETYEHNHKNTIVYGDVCNADYNELQNNFGKFDIVIGGPPCQGFSNANRQKNTAISMNNMLVKEYMRAVIELKPLAFVMENVSMLKSDVHRFYMEKSDIERVKKYSIPKKLTDLELLPEKFKFKEAIDIVKDLNEIEKYLWNEELYSAINLIYKTSKNLEKVTTLLEKKEKIFKKLVKESTHSSDAYISKISKEAMYALLEYYDSKVDIKQLIQSIEPAIMIQRMLGKAKEIYDHDIDVEEYTCDKGIVAKIYSFAVYDYIKYILSSTDYNYSIESDVLAANEFGVPQKRNRFVIIGVKKDCAETFEMPKGKTKVSYTVRDAIEDIEDIPTVYNVSDDTGQQLAKKTEINKLAKKLRNSKTLYNHIITQTTEIAMQRFKALSQGENFHTLDDSMKTTYTDPSRTQNTVYLRLNYDEPSGTVINVRKSMWVHPTLDRALSVREAARLQTFPDSFRFYGSKDKQYQQVGNAVPPMLSKAIAQHLLKIIDKE